jgi:hypothetical protein
MLADAIDGVPEVSAGSADSGVVRAPAVATAPHAQDDAAAVAAAEEAVAAAGLPRDNLAALLRELARLAGFAHGANAEAGGADGRAAADAVAAAEAAEGEALVAAAAYRANAAHLARAPLWEVAAAAFPAPSLDNDDVEEEEEEEEEEEKEEEGGDGAPGESDARAAGALATPGAVAS